MTPLAFMTWVLIVVSILESIGLLKIVDMYLEVKGAC